ncbi:MAG: capsid cement protein [Geobacteraceae bacterium]
MAKNFVYEGKTINYTNGTAAAIVSGAPVVVGCLVCVALTDIAVGAVGVLATEGVWELPKVAGASGHAIAQGTTALFDISEAKFDINTTVAAAGDISKSCVATEAALTTATTVNVKINVGPGTIEAGP